MERKSLYIRYTIFICIIRIEPDWNVNKKKTLTYRSFPLIRIEPDWNVNTFWAKSQTLKRYIRIEPDWNVNTL